jgi:hypothetical protein
MGAGHAGREKGLPGDPVAGVRVVAATSLPRATGQRHERHPVLLVGQAAMLFEVGQAVCSS